ncbi:SDR family NAD(P)-dependent oxidoreductase [Prauserella flavalba]|uniref:Short-chain dehydrogenase n=1 Tax=Prauserella flavalba TaxID=1477506 RepID=A0A318LRI2_9PSEU|nr:SDR family NAD(P)-dependent oxidoreductase [Prauserella flavalba]PXY37001.1 short-chain dehydrogenase [Prauserella flavalba]
MTTSPNTGPFTGRVVLITGASRGIGAATARAFAAEGAHTVLASRDGAALHALRDEIAQGGGSAHDVPTDVADDAAVAHAVDVAVARFGRLDVAVNNAAAHGSRPVPLAAMSPRQFDTTIAVSLRGVFLCLRHEIGAMTEGGSIVNVASTAAEQGVAGLADYVAAKHGVVGLTRTAALDHAADGIRVNAVLPGPIHTERLERAGERARALVAGTLPLRRLGRPAEVAQTILWLCGPTADFVTGAVLAVDGGRLAGTPAFVQR